jgi:hypothetical protein
MVGKREMRCLVSLGFLVACTDEGPGPLSGAVYPDPLSPDETVLTLEAPEGHPSGSYLGTYRNDGDPVVVLDGLTPDQLVVRFTGFAQLDVQFGAGEIACAEVALRSLGFRQRECGNHVRMDLIR